MANEYENLGMPSFRLDGKVALITGAGTGIGAGVALAFSAAGADVVLVARTQGNLDQVAEVIRRPGHSGQYALPEVRRHADGAQDRGHS